MDFKKGIVLLVAVCLLSGCSDTSSSPKKPASADITDKSEDSQISNLGEASEDSHTSSQNDVQEITPGSIYTGEINVNIPEASGEVVYEGNGVTIDASHTVDGYVMVRCEGATARLKVRVSLGEQKYDYDLKQDGTYEVYPLQMGNGTYEIAVFQHVEGTTYSQLYSTPIEVNMPDTNRVFVFPSQYIWYTNEAGAVKLSYDLCADLEKDSDKVERIYNYVVEYLSYDYEQAETVQKGYLPDLEKVLKSKKGICFDYSALFAAMLRAQDIPVRLAIGHVQPDNVYHAWNQVQIDGTWVWMDSTFGPDSTRTESDYTKEREY